MPVTEFPVSEPAGTAYFDSYPPPPDPQDVDRARQELALADTPESELAPASYLGWLSARRNQLANQQLVDMFDNYGADGAAHAAEVRPGVDAGIACREVVDWLTRYDRHVAATPGLTA